jgi:NADPH2:quinone reductase
VVFDPVGGAAFDQSVRCIGWEGRILVVGFASGDIPKVATNMVLVKNFSVTGVVFGEHSWRYPEQTRLRLTELLQAYSHSRLNPTAIKIHQLADARIALAEMASRRVVGKLVLVP